MKSSKPAIVHSTKKFESALKKPEKEHYVLKLYVTGASPQSVSAITNINKICEDHLKGRYALEVIDLFQKPNLSSGEQILAAPTLIKKLPLPLRRIIGNLSDSEKVLIGLDLRLVKK